MVRALSGLRTDETVFSQVGKQLLENNLICDFWQEREIGNRPDFFFKLFRSRKLEKNFTDLKLDGKVLDDKEKLLMFVSFRSRSSINSRRSDWKRKPYLYVSKEENNELPSIFARIRPLFVWRRREVRVFPAKPTYLLSGKTRTRSTVYNFSDTLSDLYHTSAYTSINGIILKMYAL